MSRNEKICKSLKICGAFVFAILFCIVCFDSVASKAYNENRVVFGTLKDGKTNTSKGLTSDKNVLALSFEIKKFSRAAFKVSSSDVNSDLAIKITCSSVDSASIYSETITPKNKKISWSYRSEGLFAPGKYYLVIGDAGKSITTGKIKSSMTLETVNLYDDGDNNTYDYSQLQAVDGTERMYRFAKLYTWGISGDDNTDWIRLKTDEEGLYIRIDPLNSYNGQIRMELYSGEVGKTPELLYSYTMQKRKELLLKSLPAGNYFFKIMYDCFEDDVSVRSFERNQVVYNLLLASCAQLDKISFSSSKVTLGLKGDISKYEAKIVKKPEKAAATKTTWESSDPKVATVTDGVVKAVKAGTATITCTMLDINGNKKKTSCVVEVKPQTVTLSNKSVSIEKGAKTTLKADVTPKESVTWYSEDKTVASISKKGEISALKAGKTTVYAKTKSGVKSAVCSVTVTDKKATTPKTPTEPDKGNGSGNAGGGNDVNVNPLTDMTLRCDVQSIDVGFKKKIVRYQGPETGTWTVNDCLEVVSSDDYSVTVRGVKKGKGYVSFVYGGYSKSITIDVE